MRYAVIMAGGAGTRLWPMSRSGKPKQLLRFIPGQDGESPRSLLQVAAGRLRGLVEAGNVYVCTGAAYEKAVLAELPLLGESQLLGEPMARDTANAVGFSAAVLFGRDPEAAFAVLTADHIIEPVDVFQGAMRKAFEAVEKRPEFLITFGITPTFAATGFGYLERGAELAGLPGVPEVEAFREKPKEDVAKEYFAAGNYAWNSGMFVWKARAILEQLRLQLPAAYEGLMKIAAAWDTPQRAEVLEAVYPTLPKISIDFGVMEKAAACGDGGHAGEVAGCGRMAEFWGDGGGGCTGASDGGREGGAFGVEECAGGQRGGGAFGGDDRGGGFDCDSYGEGDAGGSGEGGGEN